MMKGKPKWLIVHKYMNNYTNTNNRRTANKNGALEIGKKWKLK